MLRINILLVEDNDGDILLTRETFEEANLDVVLNVVRNGEDGVNYVFKSGIYNDVLRPDLILLDINLPLKDGFEVLQLLKGQKETESIPVIMYSTSVSQRDRTLANNYQADHYLPKPTEPEEFLEMVQEIKFFWSKFINPIIL